MATGCDPLYVQLGARLREARRAARTSQDALARVVGLSRTSITNIEKGRQPVQVHLLMRLADAVGVPPAALLPDRGSQQDRVRPRALSGLERRSREWVEKVLTGSSNVREDDNASTVRRREEERA